MRFAVTRFLFCLLAAIIMCRFAGPGMSAASAEDEYDIARRDYPELFQVYYDANVLEYCGLVTEQSVGGFRMVRDELIARDALIEDQYRVVRIAGYIEADTQYENHGLGGFKGWCKSDGKDAYDRFVAYYLAHHAAP